MSVFEEGVPLVPKTNNSNNFLDFIRTHLLFTKSRYDTERSHNFAIALPLYIGQHAFLYGKKIYCHTVHCT